MRREEGAPLVYLVDWLPPELGATGQYGLIFATRQARAGRDVSLIGFTSGPASQACETFEGGGRLTIERLHATPASRRSQLRRLAWSFWSDVRLTLAAWRRIGWTRAEVLFTGSPPFMIYFVSVLKVFARVNLTYRVTDFYPEVVIAAAGKKTPLLALIERATWALRRRIDRFQALGEDQRRILLAGGVAAAKIELVRDVSPVVFAGGAQPMNRPAALGGRLALLYSGNLGVAHETETIVQGLAEHHHGGSDRAALWLNGWGAGAAVLAERLAAAGTPLARTPPVPLEDLAALLAAADIHLITLRAAFAGYVLPSKVYGCVASRKPVLFVGPAASDVHLICERTAGLAYRRVEPGDTRTFLEALDALAVQT